MPYRLIVFDLDGTLIDSLRDLAEAIDELLVTCGGRPLAAERVGGMVGDGAAVLVSRAFSAAGLAPPADALERFLALYDAHLLRHTRPYDGIPRVLAELSARAHLAVLTNKPLAQTRELLAGLGLAKYFPRDAVLGGDGPWPRKPDAAGLVHLAAAAGVPLREAVLVGDSIVDWQTAKRAGTAVCLARYGFGFAGITAEALQGAESVAATPHDLVRVL
jgi:phosphoglycolate phosphatase